VQIRWRTK